MVAHVHEEDVSSAEGPAHRAWFGRDVVPLLEPLYRHALRMTSHHADAEDLLQETMLKAYVGLDSFQPGTNLKAWLYRIMTNVYISGYRTKKRQPVQHPTEQISDRQLVASAAHWHSGMRSAEDQALEMLTDPDIEAALQALPERARSAVYFADIAGYSYREIAALAHVRPGTVGSRLSRARQQLRNSLTESHCSHNN